MEATLQDASLLHYSGGACSTLPPAARCARAGVWPPAWLRGARWRPRICQVLITLCGSVLSSAFRSAAQFIAYRSRRRRRCRRRPESMMTCTSIKGLNRRPTRFKTRVALVLVLYLGPPPFPAALGHSRPLPRVARGFLLAAQSICVRISRSNRSLTFFRIPSLLVRLLDGLDRSRVTPASSSSLSLSGSGHANDPGRTPRLWRWYRYSWPMKPCLTLTYAPEVIPLACGSSVVRGLVM
ncbi:hypothetical protein C8Q79DRAFT_384536 [Trametes meyenii]|nr:hypothetical protein C8Q79DRAFT_384536 [Trametes meyenii]